MKKIILLGFLIGITVPTFSQSKTTYSGFPSLVWPKLYDISFVEMKDDLGVYDKPIFSAAAKSLNRKSVVIPGYMVPFGVGTKGTRFMITSLPLNACFFCGAGGPETVVEVTSKSSITYTDKLIEIKGILRLNDKDPDRMIYILEQAEFLGTIDF